MSTVIDLDKYRDSNEKIVIDKLIYLEILRKENVNLNDKICKMKAKIKQKKMKVSKLNYELSKVVITNDVDLIID